MNVVIIKITEASSNTLCKGPISNSNLALLCGQNLLKKVLRSLWINNFKPRLLFVLIASMKIHYLLTCAGGLLRTSLPLRNSLRKYGGHQQMG